MLSFPQESVPGSVYTVKTAEPWQEGALHKVGRPVPSSGQWKYGVGLWGHRRPPGEQAAGQAPPGPHSHPTYPSSLSPSIFWLFEAVLMVLQACGLCSGDVSCGTGRWEVGGV